MQSRFARDFGRFVFVLLFLVALACLVLQLMQLRFVLNMISDGSVTVQMASGRSGNSWSDLEVSPHFNLSGLVMALTSSVYLTAVFAVTIILFFLPNKSKGRDWGFRPRCPTFTNIALAIGTVLATTALVLVMYQYTNSSEVIAGASRASTEGLRTTILSRGDAFNPEVWICGVARAGDDDVYAWGMAANCGIAQAGRWIIIPQIFLPLIGLVQMYLVSPYSVRKRASRRSTNPESMPLKLVPNV